MRPEAVSMMGVNPDRAQARRRSRDSVHSRHRARCQNAREGWGLSALSRRAVGGRHDVQYIAQLNREIRDVIGADRDRCCNALYADLPRLRKQAFTLLAEGLHSIAQLVSDASLETGR